MTQVITVIGGSGFVGRHLVQRLAKTGAQIRLGVRNAEAAKRLKPLGNVGQIVPMGVDIGRGIGLEAAVAGADVVINLVGILAPGGGNRSFEAVQAEGAQRVAEVAKAAGVARFIHMSALGADAASKSRYAQTKAAGEAAVLAVYPSAMIVRPSIIFGPEDGFFNRFATMARMAPALPLIGGGETKFQPVFVGDVAEAIVSAVNDPTISGIYELGGPLTYSFKDLLAFTLETAHLKAVLLPIPFCVASLMGSVMQFVPGAPITADQVELLKTDNVVSGRYPGLADLGLTGATIEAIVPAYLARFHPGGRFGNLKGV
ncbi:3-beta hydroxysteroid dehydrogenase [Elstera litoralis]|uniref:3-beta hydroxysteroid dehydrogenase n=1 Tax=Elstera litoralis TaxID=552518 RepID=A0A0F3IQT9_9PROT|nr:complex I NDUFA9 subunit family protein [Elstera litoralis]KJV09095.1 3-beta hydroxysteroid dehydrogenase [Elstera litoralis]